MGRGRSMRARPPGSPCLMPGSTRRQQPSPGGARALHSSSVGLEHRPDAGSQGVWRGSSAVQLTGRPCAARAWAVVGPMATNCRKKTEGSQQSLGLWREVGDAGGTGCRARWTSC